MHAPNRPTVRRMVGLDVSDTHIAAAQVGLGGDGTFRLEAAGWAMRPLAADQRQTAAIVRAVFRQAGLASAPVCTSLPSHSLVVRRVHYPRLQDDELPRALSLDAEEALQMSCDAVHFDWQLNAPASPADTDSVDALLIAAPKADVDNHLHMLLRAGIVPCDVNAGCIALANLFLALKGQPAASSAVCVVAPGERRTDIAVLSREQGLLPRTVLAPARGGANSKASYLTDCVADTLKYHAFKLRGPPVSGLVLTGVVSQRDLPAHDALRGLVPEITVWNPVADLNVEKTRLRSLSDGDSGLRFATSIGLALQRF